jgi:hypothetical protein
LGRVGTLPGSVKPSTSPLGGGNTPNSAVVRADEQDAMRHIAKAEVAQEEKRIMIF